MISFAELTENVIKMFLVKEVILSKLTNSLPRYAAESWEVLLQFPSLAVEGSTSFLVLLGEWIGMWVWTLKMGLCGI